MLFLSCSIIPIPNIHRYIYKLLNLELNMSKNKINLEKISENLEEYSMHLLDSLSKEVEVLDKNSLAREYNKRINDFVLSN